MRFTPPCDSFDILSLFPPNASGGMCFEEDGEPDDGGDSGSKGSDEGKQSKGLQQAKAAEAKARQAAEARAAELEQQLAAFKAQQEETERKAAEEQGEYKSLYEKALAELNPLKEQFSALTAREQARVDALTAANAEALKALPEGLRKLVPEGLDPEAMAAQIRAVQTLAKTGGPSGGIPPRQTAKGTEEIPEAAAREALALGYSEDNIRSYFERVWKPRQERNKKRA